MAASISAAFRFPQKWLHKIPKTILILDCLFAKFSSRNAGASFSFLKFIENYLTNKSAIKWFLITILNSLYFGELNLDTIQKEPQRQSLELLLLQILAETAGSMTIRKTQSWCDSCVNCSLDLATIIIDHVRDQMEKDHMMKFNEYPLTHGLHLLFHAVGAAEFNANIENVLRFQDRNGIVTG